MGKLVDALSELMRIQRTHAVNRRVENIMGFYLEPSENHVTVGKSKGKITLTWEEAEGLAEMLLTQLHSLNK